MQCQTEIAQLHIPIPISLGRSALDKLLQVRLGSNTKHKLARLISDNSKLLLLALLAIWPRLALEELLELLERRVHRDHLVDTAFTVESLHRR